MKWRDILVVGDVALLFVSVELYDEHLDLIPPTYILYSFVNQKRVSVSGMNPGTLVHC